MCARFVFFSGRAFGEEFGVVAVPDITPRYNIAPTQLVLGVVQTPEGREVAEFQWGLVPGWAQDPTTGTKLINARAETLAEKPSFKEAYRKRRCLIPTDGFYEWKGPPKDKQPYYVTCEHHPFAFAGLWERWRGPEGELLTCTLVTTEANGLMEQFHDRMPAILSPDEYAMWLDPDAPQPVLDGLLDPYPANEMSTYTVGKAVGNSKNDDPSLIEPVAGTSLFD